MSAKIDTLDKKILYELDYDSRQSNAKIAKKLGKSTEVVSYRIKKLEQENIITHYVVIVNLSKLNVVQFKICLEFQHMSSKILKNKIETLKKKDAVKWIAECKGSWDMMISCETESIAGVEELKQYVLSVFAGYVREKGIAILVKGLTHNRDYLIKDNSSLHRSRRLMIDENPVAIDETDHAILKKLVENGRMPLTKMAQELNTTARVVNYRIRQMKKNNIILGFKISLNYEKLGIRFYKTFITIESSNERARALDNYLAQQKSVIHTVKVLSSWDLEPEFEVYSEKEFDEALQEMKDMFSDIIKSIDIATISKEHKFIYF